MRILFTGFDPFGGEKINPAGEAVKMMKNEIQGAEILKLEVPTVFGKACHFFSLCKPVKLLEHSSFSLHKTLP